MPDLHPIAKARYIVDTHAHVGPYFFHVGADDATENRRMCRHWGITRQVVSHSRGVFHDAVAGNEELASILDDYDELLGYAVVNQRDLAVAQRETERWLQPGSRFVGIKIHTHYPDAPIASPQMRETFEMLDEHDAVVLIHTWGPDVVHLAQLIEPLRRVRVIAGHMGADRWDLACEAARAVGNLWIEPSCSVALAGQMRYVMQHAPRDKVLFGTDSTLLDPAVAFGQVAAADLPQDQLDDVLWRNAHALFGDALGLADVS